MKYRDLTKGSISRSLLLFALPMIAGNLLQQLYNIADTLIVGRVLGKNALAAVGSSYTLMTFLTSVFLGLSMGSGALFSIYRGKGEKENLKLAVAHAFGLILTVTVVLNLLVYLFLNPILAFLRVPEEIWDGMRKYLLIIFAGLLASSLYNFFFLSAAGVGKFLCATDFSCGFCCFEYRTGYFICGSDSLGDCRGSTGDDSGAVCQRYRHFYLCIVQGQGVFAGQRKPAF